MCIVDLQPRKKMKRSAFIYVCEVACMMQIGSAASKQHIKPFLDS